MNNEIATSSSQVSTQVKHFKVHEGSNYKVVMKYGREEVISWDHFQSLSKKLFADGMKFTTVNDIIVQVDDIRMIEPTKEKTERQKKKSEIAAAEARKIQDRADYLTKMKQCFDVGFFNAKFGADTWIRLNSSNRRSSKHVINQDDIQECWSAFETQYPNEASEIKKLVL